MDFPCPADIAQEGKGIGQLDLPDLGSPDISLKKPRQGRTILQLPDGFINSPQNKGFPDNRLSPVFHLLIFIMIKISHQNDRKKDEGLCQMS